ncbi:hypothetical protein WKT02_02455 [Erysipelotrichaceae bacterium HCN-30851]|uniref:hypothetical protein n=1 Tax=Clostridium sp. C1 TaxID=1155388 RepID=UPI001BA9B2D4|nr:hypothetical protein [Clostridium sp. C1]QUN12740.1 hypothetical protein KEC48_14900 [Clostridium sp. C1]
MDPRVKRTITKLEQQKEKKTNEKKRIEQELSEIDANLKQLYAFKKEQDKLQSSIDRFYEPIKKDSTDEHSESVYNV